MNRVITYIKINFKLTSFLIGINVALYLLTLLVASFFKGNFEFALLFMGADYTPFVLNGEVWRMITSAFLHGSILHLFLNMYALYVVATFIERFYGRRKLLTIYVITAIFGSLANLIGVVTEFWSSGGVGIIQSISVGASGAIFGMIGVLLGSRAKKSIYEPQVGVDSQQLIYIIIYNLVIGIAINTIGGGAYINIWAHFGGLLGGFILGLILPGINAFYVPTWKKYVSQGLYVFSIVALLASFIAQIVFIISHLS